MVNLQHRQEACAYAQTPNGCPNTHLVTPSGARFHGRARSLASMHSARGAIAPLTCTASSRSEARGEGHVTGAGMRIAVPRHSPSPLAPSAFRMPDRVHGCGLKAKGRGTDPRTTCRALRTASSRSQTGSRFARGRRHNRCHQGQRHRCHSADLAKYLTPRQSGAKYRWWQTRRQQMRPAQLVQR